MNEELSMLLSNIQSLLNEVAQTLQGQGGQIPEQQSPDQPAQMANNPNQPDNSDNPDDQMQKSITQTASDGKTANDSAEARLEPDDMSQATSENVNDVAKSVMAMLLEKLSPPKKVIQKSEMDIMTEMTGILSQIAKSQQEIANKQQITDTAVMNILKGLNIAEEIEKSVLIEKSEPQKQKQTNIQKGLNNPEELTQLNNLLKSITGKQQDDEEKTDTAMSRGQYVQKKLRDPNFVMGFLKSGNK